MFRSTRPTTVLAIVALAAALATSMAPAGLATLADDPVPPTPDDAAATDGPADVDWEAAPSPAGTPSQDIGGNDEVLVVNTWDEGTLRSTDGGQTWEAVDAEGVTEGTVVFDPSDPDRGYIAGFGGLVRTTDAGQTWEMLKETDRARVVDVHPDGTVAASIRADDTFESQTFLLSEDGGDTWTEMSKPYEGSTSLEALAFGPTSDQIAVASLGNTWVTDDGGDTWTEQDQGARWIVSDDDGTMWRAGMGETHRSDDGSFEEHPERSVDGGQTWESVPFHHVPRGITIHPDGGLYVATEHGVHRTTDEGETWTDMGAGPVARLSTGLMADPANPDAVFFTDEQVGLNWVGPSQDGDGYTYEGRTTGFPSVEISRIESSPAGDVLLAAGPQGLYTSTDTETWNHAGAGLGFPSMEAAAASDTGDIVYAGGATFAYQPYVQIGSVDGTGWTTVILEQNDATVVDLEIHPDDPETAWAAVRADLSPSRVYETTDGGQSWEPTFVSGLSTPVDNVNLGVHDVTYDETNDTLLAATGVGVFVQGEDDRWTPRATDGEDVWAVEADHGTVLADGLEGQLWRAHTDEQLFLPWAETGTVHEIEIPAYDEAWSLDEDGTVHTCVDDPNAETSGTCEATPAPAEASSIEHVPTEDALLAATPSEGLYRTPTS